jgi:hypothetical protein
MTPGVGVGVGDGVGVGVGVSDSVGAAVTVGDVVDGAVATGAHALARMSATRSRVIRLP